ncbi:MAG TPA: sodium:calcium symporter [Opitutaceae bacterium]|nr:sodium:calcium symporter [Opitutaceae bacterium]
MAPLSHWIDTLGLAGPWTYVGLFLVASLLMMWRLEAMLDQGLEGTALGTIVMPYCSGLGNLIFVYLVLARHDAVREVLTNCLVNNVTNLTLLLGLPAMFWGLAVIPPRKGGGGKKRGGADTANQINRLSLLLTLTAVIFFTGAVWVLGQDGRLDRADGLMLIGLFVFWQCFQVFDVLKHNARQRKSFGPLFYLDAVVVLASAYALYGSIDWLVTWLGHQHGGFINAGHLGWLSGWLMVLPNALLAFYWGWKRRADIVYSSQVGDGHICLPLALGLCAAFHPVAVPAFVETSLLLLLGAAGCHILFLLAGGGLPRWAGWLFVAAYGWFLYDGLLR